MTETPDTFLVQDGQTLVFIGDSITDCGRRDQAFPFGAGYVRFAIDLITARYPDRGITYHNQGIGGDVSTGLLRRWNGDVLDHQPDWVSVMIGINDLHRRFSATAADHISPDAYREAYHAFLTLTAAETDARIILIDPFYITRETDPDSHGATVLAALNDYIAVAQEMATEFDALHVPLHAIFQEHLDYRAADVFCPEPVHPNASGHLVIAQAWLKTMGW
ncbi:SGNH/GDSL hydrolase family protein [Candidatus Poribacteria bacterium]|jgi:lysophospholipase L1-like esterase|nr:SGNH/GDSL hydrolase family protein [Candidatus Poribacteria bacterium]MBT5536535.1 SGNH/GDSL hydrolase family protein [Candidatus Poribacteria bacterium]MBT5714438.1 SGNH/GDSL hydrolase family protein [Candidatus Poribacteria bacterium]MBT7100349.1 SGNH/GDSL hydrolase family protein [Candidatus Poribacteria bacterium]MBT7805569.1 SGNH/GDSL hydrolase family protein [Candidatus Poribacteria bacterium]